MNIKTLTNNIVIQIAPAGNRKFLHIKNTSGVVIYLKYDGSGTTLDATTGMPLAINEFLFLNNDSKNIFTDAVFGFQASGADKTINVQGID
jgi:hypothetical protein